MKGPNTRHFIAGASMLLTAAFAAVAVPDRMLAETAPPVDLEVLIPRQLGDWRVDESIIPVLPSADVQLQLKKIYTQTLARTYINSKGEHIMLSIAYGRAVHGELQTHVPEVCYPSQGFDLLKSREDVVKTRFGDIPDKQLLARRGPRTEPITYWMTVGDAVVRVGWRWRLNQLRYGLTGAIPDAMLVRVSNIGIDEEYSYQLQRSFIDSMLSSLGSPERAKLIGSLRSG